MSNETYGEGQIQAFAVILGPDAEPELVRNTIRMVPGVDTVSAQTDTERPPTWNDVAALRASNERLREAVGLLNSMVLSGEDHSTHSRQIVRDAVASPW